MAHDTYMRPGDLAELKWENIFAPQPSLGPGAEFWAVVMHQSADGRPSKTGIYDDGLLPDSLHHQYLYPHLARMKKQLPRGQKLFPLPM
eukprot:7034768-Karenia_brevis.AAC.1